MDDDDYGDEGMLDTLAEALRGRHTGTKSVAQWFSYSHLEGPARIASAACCRLAISMLLTTPDGPELTTGLRKLLEAKDCFVRANVDSGLV